MPGGPNTEPAIIASIWYGVTSASRGVSPQPDARGDATSARRMARLASLATPRPRCEKEGRLLVEDVFLRDRTVAPAGDGDHLAAAPRSHRRRQSTHPERS